MLRIVLYEILDGRMSPSQWARDCQTSKELQYLARGIDPRRTTLYEFRDRAEKFINAIHKQLLQQANDEGILDGQEASIDGTFIDALASRHRIVNQPSLDKRMQRLDSIRERDLEGEKIPDTEIPNWMAKTIGGREEQQGDATGTPTRTGAMGTPTDQYY